MHICDIVVIFSNFCNNSYHCVYCLVERQASKGNKQSKNEYHNHHEHHHDDVKSCIICMHASIPLYIMDWEIMQFYNKIQIASEVMSIHILS